MVIVTRFCNVMRCTILLTALLIASFAQAGPLPLWEIEGWSLMLKLYRNHRLTP